MLVGSHPRRVPVGGLIFNRAAFPHGPDDPHDHWAAGIDLLLEVVPAEVAACFRLEAKIPQRFGDRIGMHPISIWRDPAPGLVGITDKARIRVIGAWQGIQEFRLTNTHTPKTCPIYG